MNIKEMTKDRDQLLLDIQRCQQQINQLTIQVWRYQGVVAYLDDNIAKSKKKEE